MHSNARFHLYRMHSPAVPSRPFVGPGKTKAATGGSHKWNAGCWFWSPLATRRRRHVVSELCDSRILILPEAAAARNITQFQQQVELDDNALCAAHTQSWPAGCSAAHPIIRWQFRLSPMLSSVFLDGSGAGCVWMWSQDLWAVDCIPFWTFVTSVDNGTVSVFENWTSWKFVSWQEQLCILKLICGHNWFVELYFFT